MKPTPITALVAPDAPPTPDTPTRAEAASPFVKAKFDALLLVCGRCAGRSSGPSKRKAKKLPGEFKKALGQERPRFRIVESSCLGLCPKKATAVAAAVDNAPVRLAAVRDKDDVQAVADGLRGRR
jgi:predicted metal-binding protein